VEVILGKKKGFQLKEIPLKVHDYHASLISSLLSCDYFTTSV